MVTGGPRLLVVITTSPDQRDVTATLRSLAPQTDVTCETAVVDDMPDAVGALQRAVDASRAPFITVLQAGDVLLPGALLTLCGALDEAPYAGMVHALSLPLGVEGQISRQDAHARSARPWALPTFRRAALEAGGPFRGRSPVDAVRVAARQIASRGEARRLSVILAGTAGPGPDAAWRTAAAARLLRSRRWARQTAGAILRALHAPPIGAALWWLERPYASFGALLARWSFDGVCLPRRQRPPDPRGRIAYAVVGYPALSETFVRREVMALRAAGIPLDVFALGPGDWSAAMDASSPAGPVENFGPLNEQAGRAAVWAYARRQPWTVVRLWLFIVRHNHSNDPAWWRDRNLLYLAGQLATALTTKRAAHVHAVWADQLALVALVASRLVGVTFSAQARASEIHRTAQAPFVADRLRFAEFVVTNSSYNERDLRRRLAPVGVPPIQVVYNGLDLSRFRPAAGIEREGGPFRILSVGRLVEPKGYKYLLHACRSLRDRGVELSCDIIGARVEPGDTVTWLQLRMLLTSLDLDSTVFFQGAQPFSTVLTAFARADIFVLPCVQARDGSHDITPNALIEAMAMGLPVVSTTSGGVPEIVDHGINGLLVPPNNAAALSDAIERLIGDVELRRTLGAAARLKVEERFDIERNVVRRAALFRSLLAQPAGEVRDASA